LTGLIYVYMYIKLELKTIYGFLDIEANVLMLTDGWTDHYHQYITGQNCYNWAVCVL